MYQKFDIIQQPVTGGNYQVTKLPDDSAYNETLSVSTVTFNILTLLKFLKIYSISKH